MNDVKNEIKNLVQRPPVVVVMGHVDHGKTTLLDYIKKTNLAAKEAGGITQSIGAYEIEHGGKKITFIDTPGHEAFSKMRARGAKVADLAILVVAADDGVKPQTKESIEILRSVETPFVVAVNKIDKPNADIERTKNDLTANGVLLEGYGGNVSWQAISAKSGKGVNELLDLILLAAEMENFVYNPAENAKGVIIEAKSDARKGNVAIAILKDGILKTGDKIATGSASGKIKIIEDFLGKKAKELLPSAPAMILGFETLPQIGEEFVAGEEIDLSAIKRPEKKLPEVFKKQEIIADKKAIINVILKADVSGSLETLSEIVKNLKYENAKINVLNESIGEITDGDVKSAVSSKAVVIGFNVKLNKIAESLAKAQNVKIIVSKIIYELVDAIDGEVKSLEKPAPLGSLEIIKIFSRKEKKQLVGGKVISGSIKNNSRLKILRNDEEIGLGKITSLKRVKQEIAEARENEECGLMFESDVLVNEGDVLILPAK